MIDLKQLKEVDIDSPSEGEFMRYKDGRWRNDRLTVRTVNGETMTGDDGGINLHDGFVFPNAVQDVCGNWYDAVVVGDQVWMTENLRTTKYPDGTDIPYGNDFTTEAGKYYYYSSPASYRTKYGLLYNWTALMNGSPESDSNPSGVQGIAPSGWHVPSLAEWQQLDDYVKRQKRHNLGTDSAPMIKKALASRQYWYAVAETGNYIGTDTNKNNSTGLNLKAGGAFYEGSGAAQRPSFCAHYWSSTQSDEDKAYFFAMSYTGASYNPVVNSVGSKTRYLAVRCVSNLNPVQFRAWYVDEYGSMQNHRPDEHPLSADLVTDGSQNKVFTLALKDKLDSIEEGAQKNVQADWNQDDPDADDFIKGKPQPAVPSGTCDSTSTSTAYVANNVQGITALKDGVAVYLYNGVVTSAGASADVAYGESVPSGKGFTLNINGLGAKPVTISRYASTIATSEWTKGYRYLFIYNSGRVSGGAWEMYGVDKDTDTLPIVYCTTAGGTRGKVGKCTNGLLRTNSYYYVFMTTSNTYSSNYITLNVNNKGAKRIYINGETSGVSNYDLPSGMYFVWYDGINFHFRTDGKLPLKGGAFGGSFNDLTEKPTIPADKVFRCQFLYVSGEGLMSDNVTPNDILNAHIAGKIVICDMVTDLYSTSTIDVVMMLSDTENGPAFTGVRDCNGQTICFKMRYDTDEREWVVSTVNIGQSPVQADWNATSGLSQILNKPKHRTINGEILTGDGCDINIHDGLYFPDAAQDYEGNTYGAVVIGNQVWLSENLRTRFFPNGYWIYPGGNNESETIPYYYNNDNSNIPLKERGYLYNLAAVLHDASTSETTPSGVQGIAPDGWHIPSAAECEQLLDYVKDQKRFSEFSENGSLQYAKSLAARKRWTSTNLPGTIGYNQEDNNATGFSLVPSGTRQGGQIAREGTIGFFATCSIYNDTGNWLVYGANNADEQLGWFGSYKTDAFAVRCVSDLNPVQFLSWYIEKYGTIQHKVESMRIYRGVWGLQSNNRIEAELDVDDLNNVDLKSRYGVLLILSVTTDIPANGHLTIKGSDVVVESEIYYRGSRLTSGLIQRGDTCIVMYRYMGGTNLSFLLSNDRWGQMLSALQDTAVTIHSGSGIPDDDIGSDGDIYIQIQS